MLLGLFFLSLTIIIGVLIDYVVYLNIGMYYLWIGVLCLIPTFIILYILWLLYLTIWGAFFNKKKPVKKPNMFYYWFLQQTDALTMFLLGVKTKMTYQESVPCDRRFVIVTNHVSNFDQMIIIQKMKQQPIICVTKPENLSFPVAGPFIHHAGFIPINRHDNIEGMKAIKQASEVLMNNQGNICISPEGTRNKTSEPLLPFHAGSFKVATYAKAPIVIAALKNTSTIHKRAPFRVTHVYFDILKVLYYEDYQNMTTQEIATLSEHLIKEDLINNQKGV